MMYEVKELTLPSGQKVTITGKELFGKDLIAAQRFAKQDGDTAAGFALMAALLERDGKPLIYPDILEMSVADITALSQALKDDPRFPAPPADGATPAAR